MRGVGLVAAFGAGLLIVPASCKTASVGGTYLPDASADGGSSSMSGGSGNEAGQDTGAGGSSAGKGSGSGGSAGSQGGTANAGASGSGGTPPDCDGGACPTDCGDGIVLGEACDDGNVLDNDGCSSACTIESGFTCTVTPCRLKDGVCALAIPAVFRDFNAYGSAGGHPDFQPGSNQQVAITGLVEPDLDAEGKPVLSAAGIGGSGFMHGTAAFAQWYRDTPGVNVAIAGRIMLWDNGAGGYVNRWGLNGEQWSAPPMYTNVIVGGIPAGIGCPDCTLTPGIGQCFDPCTPFQATGYACCADVVQGVFDGNPLFFPIDPPTAGLLTDIRYTGRIPDNYGTTGYPTEATVAQSLGISSPIQTATSMFPTDAHNFHFTTEVRLRVRYDAVASVRLDFTGDDDVWVFVNGKLAVDLGGWHPPLDGTVTIDATTAGNFGLVDGAAYQIAIFHAERQTDGSSFKLSLSGLDLRRTVCTPN